jgi:hypothetical protein
MFRCTVLQKKPAISCQFFWLFLSQWIPEGMEDFDVHYFVYCMPLWNGFAADKILSTVYLPPHAVHIISDSHTATFRTCKNCIFFIATLPHASSSICNVSECLRSKPQNVVCTLFCSVYFQMWWTNNPQEQTADTKWQQYLTWQNLLWSEDMNATNS